MLNPVVITTGPVQRGQFLIVWTRPRVAAPPAGVDLYLTGQSDHPAPLP